MELEERDQSASRRTVTQENALITACYTMGLNEKRLLISAISQLDPTSKAWKDGGEITVLAREWADTYGLSTNSAYARLREASADLYRRSVRIRGDSRNGTNVRILQAEEYSEDEGRVTIVFTPKILRYMTSLFGDYTKYDLLGVAGLKSTHSVRLYELASQFKDTGWRIIKLDDLREMFCLGEAYKDWRDLKKRVIDRSCKEITAKSDLSVEYEPMKRGRSIVAVKLRIKQKDQMELELF